MSDDNLSQRERRRQQHQANKPKVQLNSADAKKWIGPGLLLLLVGGIVTAMVVTDSVNEGQGCTGHYHYTLDIFVDERKLVLNPPGDETFFRTSSPHMHPTSVTSNTVQNLVHNHVNGGQTDGLHANHCESYEEAFDHMGIGLSDDSLTLRAIHDAIHGDGEWAGTYSAGNGKSLQVFGQAWDSGEWVELDAGDLGDKVPPVSSRLAIVYGDEGADVLALLDSAATPYPASSYPADGNPNDPPHYTSFDDLRDK